MELYTEELIRINCELFDLVTEMAASGDDRCHDVEDLRLAMVSIIWKEENDEAV